MRFMRTQEVQLTTGLSRTTIWRMEKKGLFPLRRRIGVAAVGWLSSEIEEWMKSRNEASAKEAK